MKMDRRLTNGLAWAGALLVIGVPVADYLTGAFGGGETPRVAVVDAEAAPPEAIAPAASSAAAPVATPTAVAAAPAGGAVDSFVQSGRPLPSYITGGDSSAPALTKPAAAPKPAASPAPATAVTPPAVEPKPSEQVAALPPARVAPVPMPLSMRPQPVTVPLTATQPLIIDAPPVASAPVVPPMTEDLVTAEDLEEWESGPLNEFLARRGGSSVTYQVERRAPPPREYNPNGFWLDEGPDGAWSDGAYPRQDDEVYIPF